mgnify:CR=1 FL=1
MSKKPDWSKRGRALWLISIQSAAGGGVAAVPKPGLETFAHVTLSANEIALCLGIAQIYFGAGVTREDVIRMMKEAGIAVAAGGVLAYGATKVGHGVVNELLNAGGPVGWGIKAILATSLTATVGVSFMVFCEKRPF